MRKLFKIVLSFLLALAVVPSFVFAEEDTNVAKIDDTEYSTFLEAVNAADSDDEIILINDATIGSVIEISKNLTVNLNGYTLTNTSKGARCLKITEAINFTIDGTVDGSKFEIKEDSDSYGLIESTANATITLNGGTYSGDTDDGGLFRFNTSSTWNLYNLNVSTNNRILVENTSTDDVTKSFNINVEGGTYTTTQESNDNQYAFQITCLFTNADGNITEVYNENRNISFKDVTITARQGAVQTASSIATFEDCTIKSTGEGTSYFYTAVSTAGGGIASIYSGTYEGYNTLYVFSSGGTINVYGGDFKSTGGTLARVDVNSSYANDGYIYIYDGSFDGTSTSNDFYENPLTGINAEVIVYHGEFTNVSNLSDFVEDYSVDDTTTPYTNYVTTDSNGKQEVHQLYLISAKDPTCTDTGNTEYYECVYVDCDTYFTASTDEAGNTTYAETTLAAVTIAANGHTEGESVTENYVEATCEEDGSYDTVVYCSVCGTELSRGTTTIPATGHSFDDGAVTSKATCDEDGVLTYTCTVCGYTYTEAISALGHNWDYDNIEWVWSEDYTSATGTIYCLNNSEHILTVDATITSEVTKEATTESTGTITYTATITDEDGNVYIDTKEVETDKLSAVVEADPGDDNTDDGDDSSTTTTAATSSETEESAETDTSDSYSIMLYTVVGLASLVSMYGIKAYRKRKEN